MYVFMQITANRKKEKFEMLSLFLNRLYVLLTEGNVYRLLFLNDETSGNIFSYLNKKVNISFKNDFLHCSCTYLQMLLN